MISKWLLKYTPLETFTKMLSYKGVLNFDLQPHTGARTLKGSYGSNINEPVHKTSNDVVCATSKASDQPAHARSLIRAFASRLNIL